MMATEKGVRVTEPADAVVRPPSRGGGRWRPRWIAFTVAGLLTAACTSQQSALSPQGPRAGETLNLWWVALGLAAVVYVGVIGFLIVAAFRRRDAGAPAEGRRFVGSPTFIGLTGGIIPAVILASLFSYDVLTLDSLSAPPQEPATTIEVIGHQWWWEVRYPAYGAQALTANEIHVPAGQPVELRLTSADVIHSFWVPELSGKIDLIPGNTTTLWLQADEPGVYRGQCAEFCGVQHTNMALHVVSEPADQFAAWAQRLAQPAPEPANADTQRGRDVFMNQGGCLACHTIRGTQAAGTVGPDLTHLAGRDWLAAGIIPNNPGTLGGWITNSQTIKPGNRMPPIPLSPDDLQALLAYLETLQ